MHYSSRCRRHIVGQRRKSENHPLAQPRIIDKPGKGTKPPVTRVYFKASLILIRTSSCLILTHAGFTEAFTNRTSGTGQTPGPFACSLLCDDTRMISAHSTTGAALFLYLQGLLHRVFCVYLSIQVLLEFR